MDIDGKDLGHAALQEMRDLSPTIAPQPMAGAFKRNLPPTVFLKPSLCSGPTTGWNTGWGNFWTSRREVDGCVSALFARYRAIDRNSPCSIADPPENPRSPTGVFIFPSRLSPAAPCTSTRWPRCARAARCLISAVPTFRIRLPPARSRVRTCLSREFAFLGRATDPSPRHRTRHHYNLETRHTQPSCPWLAGLALRLAAN